MERELRLFFRDPLLSKPVEFAGVSTYSDDNTQIRGLFDGPSSIGFGDSGTAGMEQRQPELRLPFNAFDPMPESGDTITVDGKYWTCDQPYGEEDGMIRVIPLLEAE